MPSPNQVWPPRSSPRPCAFLLLAFGLVCSAIPSASQENSGTSASASQTLAIPDGTEIQLRFAQPVYGRNMKIHSELPRAKKGDTVRLVAARDVRADNLVVIAKGALAQATVSKVWLSFNTVTGLKLTLDWVQDVTGEQIPLRAAKEGRPGPFRVRVYSTEGGTKAAPETLRGDYIGRDSTINAFLHTRYWVPAGTRIMAYVHGTTTPDFAAVKEAQALLVPQGDTATLTIYRVVGYSGHPKVVCDSKEVSPALDKDKQYTSLDLSPGKHICQADDHTPLEINAIAGDDYYVRLEQSLAFKWDLKRVDPAEGEDAVAHSQPATKQPT